MHPVTQLSILATALALEMLAGYPQALFRAIGHPVTWVGALIGALDTGLNQPTDDAPTRWRAGVLALFVLLATTGIATFLLQLAILSFPFGYLVVAALASSLIASKSLEEHVRAVATALAREGLEGGRRFCQSLSGRFDGRRQLY